MKVYSLLLKNHGHQSWWPCRTGNKFEICIGAILTQNTNWSNAEKAIDNLIKADCIDEKRIVSMNITELESLIRPSGFYKQKAKRLKEFSIFILTHGSIKKFLKNVRRDELLAANGIGPETADSILLYACEKPFFVVDAYTRRMFSSLGRIKADADYEDIRKFFEENIPSDVNLYKEFHALIVKHAKVCCRGFLKDGCILAKAQ